MIVGIGVDVVYIPGIIATFSRRGIRFAKKILHESEFQEFENILGKNKSRGFQFLASRFGTKEATYKACTPSNLSWRDIAIRNDQYGRPEFIETEKLKQAFTSKQITKPLISISHDQDYVFVTVLLQS